MAESKKLKVEIKAVDNCTPRLEFIVMYTDLVNKQGYRGSFIRDKMAKHCEVSPHTVAGWVSGKPVQASHLKLLKSFEVKSE